MHPLVGNEIVRQTLTCLEREIPCAQPTIPTGLKKHTGSGSDSDGVLPTQLPLLSVRLNPQCPRSSQYPDFVPYCTMQESYTGHVPKTVVGSKAYW